MKRTAASGARGSEGERREAIDGCPHCWFGLKLLVGKLCCGYISKRCEELWRSRTVLLAEMLNSIGHVRRMVL